MDGKQEGSGEVSRRLHCEITAILVDLDGAFSRDSKREHGAEYRMAKVFLGSLRSADVGTPVSSVLCLCAAS